MLVDRPRSAALHRELHSHLPSDPALRVKTLESLAIERGLVSPETIDAWIEAYSEHIGPKRGARVVARAWTTLQDMPSKHTRLPRYARSRCGTIISHHGCHAVPDEGAKGNHTGGHLYTVSFDASELWGPDANLRDTVTLDLWEDYLVPA